ncbi:10671_t:CDS:1, partial [Dentiscutata erythropus]
DKLYIKEERTIKSQKESLWKLISDLSNAFSQPDLSHELFLNAPELHEAGFQYLFSCYDEGIGCLYKILKQDVYKTKTRDVKGRRACNVVTYKWQNLLEMDKSKIKKIKKQTPKTGIVHIKKLHQKRQTTKEERNILDPILSEKIFPNDKLPNLLSQLNTVSTGWTESHIKIFWRNNRINK